ncbi:Protein of unknown function [Propionibacterium freudenreichii]|uniref:hypothetical protein n=1 Tax=Propionibacterium freudenreichii TaxID=1744 RepID=UPI000543665A|nr:hypothetical protein [Propionibacterium freudenreichii]CEG86650.1 Protein of unknown function [Propionibacterium freudenreichii]CEI27158.1 Protein of unknown function [Propionibacterium freudenreichii]
MSLMVRSYQRTTDRSEANRPVHVRYIKRDRIDAEKVAEVLIRIALRAAGNGTTTGNAGSHLRDLLTGTR